MKTGIVIVVCSAASLLAGCSQNVRPAIKPSAQPAASTKPAENLADLAIVTTLSELQRQEAFEADYKELGEALPPQEIQMSIEGKDSAERFNPDKPPVFRFGIEALKCRQYSGVLVYCLTSNYRPLRTTSSDHYQDLGPLKVQSWYEGSKPMGLAEVKQKLAARVPAPAPHYLFVCPVLADKPGRIHVVVSTPAGRRLAAAIVEVTNEQPHPWLALRRDWRPDETGKPANVISPTDTVAWPDFAATGPIPVAGSTYVEPVPPATSVPSIPNGAHLREVRGNILGILPSIEPRDPTAYSLDLSLKGDVLTVKSHYEEFNTYGVQAFFLVRLWINGKPYVPAKPSSDVNIQMAERVSVGYSLDMLLKLEPAAIGARKDDRIGLQLLYCPAGWKTSGSLMKHPRLDDWCLGYTNRIEFIAK